MKTDGSNTVVAEKKAAPVKAPAQTLVEYLETKKASFSAMLPRGMDADRFMKMVVMAIVKVPQLAQAEFTSMLEAVGACATYGLEPDGHHAAIIPFQNGRLSEKKGRSVYDAVFVPMVHGIIALAYRSEAFKVISAREVCAKDEFEYSYDFDNTFRHVPAEGDRGEWIGVYAFFVLKAGGRDFIYMSKADVSAWGERFAKSFEKKDSLWQTNLMAAGLKTAVKRVLHFAPMAIQLPMDDEDYGMRNVTPVDAPAPVFDISDAKEVAEDAKPVPAESQPEGKPEQASNEGQPELIPAERQPGQD